jgi:hypothetical protein
MCPCRLLVPLGGCEMGALGPVPRLVRMLSGARDVLGCHRLPSGEFATATPQLGGAEAGVCAGVFTH